MSSVIPFPKSQLKPRGRRASTRLLQAHVPVKIYDACKKEWKGRGLTCKQVMDWALKQFLLNSNPEVAKKFGVHVER